MTSLNEARAAGRKRYFTGSPCRHGHVSERFVSSRGCVQCAEEKRAASSRTHYLRHRETYLAKRKSYREENREAVLNGLRAWRLANIEVARLHDRTKPRSAPHVERAYVARRRAAKLKATPAWADHAAIAGFYQTADALGMWTGEWHHVDHRVPLQSTQVCGLHVAANLRVISATENHSKGNRYWPDMPQ